MTHFITEMGFAAFGLQRFCWDFTVDNTLYRDTNQISDEK